MKLSFLTNAVMPQKCKSDGYSFGVETYMRVALFVRPMLISFHKYHQSLDYSVKFIRNIPGKTSGML